jgi:hypothetical protein
MNATRGMAPVVAAIVTAAALLAGAGGLVIARERAYPPGVTPEDRLYVSSGPTMRRMTIGYSALASDLYWIRAIQYFGDRRLKYNSGPVPAGANYDLLYPLLDITTSLDPRFNIAYRFGAIFLAEPLPGGAGRPDLGITLLQKGLDAVPDKWEYMMDAGFVHYWWTRDYASAADWFRRASETPRSPSWMKSLAATTLARGGDRRSSRAMWQALRQSADNDWVRTHAEWRLLQLRALDEIDALQEIADRAQQASPTAGQGWQRVLEYRDARGQRPLRGVPLDPMGVAYELDASGRVKLGPKSPLLPLPDEPTPMMGLPAPVQ